MKSGLKYPMDLVVYKHYHIVSGHFVIITNTGIDKIIWSMSVGYRSRKCHTILSFL